MTLGTFGCIIAMRRRDVAVETIDDLAGLDRNDRATAFILAMLMFSLAGIPPLAGFFAKFYVFLAAVQANLWPLAIIGVLSSVVGAFYYLRIIKIMYFDEPADDFEPAPAPVKMIIGVCGMIIIFFAAYPSPLITAASQAAASLF
jgi:NADH-quinone oxidoreductase subunit N